MRKARIFLTLCFLLIASHAWATSYYVTTGGSDGADGSVGTPWLTLHHACGAVSGVGDIINVAAGSYTDNTQCVLAVGVKIVGAGKASSLISSTANPYIYANSAVPTVDGSNEISGIKLTGNNANICIKSVGRNNQKIHDNDFLDCTDGIELSGVYPRYITPADGSETGTAVSAAPNKNYTIQPATTDWATGVEFYNNTAVNTTFAFHTIKGALIHHNTVNNAGAARSAFGHTSYFWSAVQFYNNEYHLSSNTASNIGIEVWHIADDTIFTNNIMDGWASLLVNIYGGNTPWSMEFLNNDFSSNIVSTGIGQALEIGYDHLENVRIDGNYFTNTGGNNTWTVGISIHGSGVMNNYVISHNVFYNMHGPGMEVDSTIWTAGAQANPANIDNIYIYNNVFDNMESGTSGAVRFVNNGTSGDLDAVFFRNNILMNLTYGFAGGAQSTVSGNFYDHNARASTTTADTNSNLAGSTTVGTTYAITPGIVGSGSRWTNWYKPSSALSNLLNIGVNVGLPFFGGVPDIGPFDWTVPSFGGTTASNVLSSTSGSFSHTVSGTHPLLLVLVSKRTSAVGNPAIATLTYNGVAMTKGPFVLNGDQYGADIWYLVNPATGSNTVAWTAADNVYTIFEAVNIVDTDTTVPLRGAGVCATGSSVTPSVDISSASTDLVIDAVVKAATTGALAQGAGQGLIADITGTSHIRGGASLEIGAATTTMSWTINSSLWAICTASIRPYVAASGLHHHPIVMQ